MIAYKSLRFLARWKGLAIFSGCFVILIAFINLDVFGYERYLPPLDRIKDAYISNLSELQMPEGYVEKDNIQQIRLLHQQITYLAQESKTAPESATRGSRRINIVYRLENGGRVARSYTVDLASYRQYLYPLLMSQETKRSFAKQLKSFQDRSISAISVNNYRLDKNIVIYNPAEVATALEALGKDVSNISYEAVMEGKVPVRANIEIIAEDTDDYVNLRGDFNYYLEYRNFEAFLAEHHYLEQLFLKPEEVEAILIKSEGNEKTYEVKEQEKIAALLNWCSIDRVRTVYMRQTQPNNSGAEPKYYGEIRMVNSSSSYIRFDSNPYARQVINEIINNI